MSEHPFIKDIAKLRRSHWPLLAVSLGCGVLTTFVAVISVRDGHLFLAAFNIVAMALNFQNTERGIREIVKLNELERRIRERN